MTVLVLGLFLGTGLSLVFAWTQARTPTLTRRLAGRLRSPGEGVSPGRVAVMPWFPAFEALVGPLLRDAGQLVERWSAGADSVAARLRRAGSAHTVEQYRAEQVAWALVAGASAAGLSVFAGSHGAAPLPLIISVAAAAVAGAAGRDVALGRSVVRREKRIVAELPALAEMLALAVSAGEGALGALERVTHIASGALAEDLRGVLGEVRSGVPFTESMRALGERTGVPELARFAEGVSVAVERGTPIADVLHAQAVDVRESGRRALMEEGGKREIAMMVPVIFLILPVTVVFAVFPGIMAIRLGH